MSPPGEPRPRLVTQRVLSLVGAPTIAALSVVGGVWLLLWQAARLGARSLVVQRGKKLAWRSLVFQLDRVGVRAIPIVMLVVFCIGVILALQIGPVLRQFGATGELSTIIAIAMFRELGPLVGAIVLTGFAGASIAAELGTMVVGEEVAALRTHAIHPVRFLVVPRVLATMVMTVCLTVLANIVGVLGGMLAAMLILDAHPHAYFVDSLDAITSVDFLTGLIKAAVFGLLIGGLACHLGLSVTRGASGVGVATTRTVVLTIVALIIVDLLFTAVFYRFDL